MKNKQIRKVWSLLKCVIVACFFLSVGIAGLAQRVASVTGDWSNTATWGGFAVPTAAETVTINSGIAVTVDIAVACNTLTFAAVTASSSVTISGTNSLTVTGLVSMPRPSTGQTCTIAVGAGSLTAGSLTMIATVTTRNDIISISTGTVTIDGAVTTGTTGCQFNFSDAGLLRFGGTFSGGPAALTPSTGTVEYTSATPVIQAFSGLYNNLTFSGTGTTTGSGSGTITIQGDLAITGGGTLNFTARPVTFTGTIATQSIASFTTTGLISMTKTAGTATFQGTVNGGALTINGSGGTLNLGTGLTHTISGTPGTLTLGGYGQLSGSWGGTGSGATYINTTYFAAATGILNVAASSCTAGAWIGGISTDWNTASNWCDAAVPTASTNVVIPPGGNQPVIGAAAVCNNMTVNSGATLTITGSNTLTVSGNWTNSGTFTANSSTVIFNGADQTVGTGPFNNLTLSTSGTKTLATATIINGNLTINTGVTLAAANFGLTFGGDFINSGGTFTAGSSPIVIAGTATQSIAGFTTTGLVSMTKTGGTATFQGNVSGAGFTINGAGGTLNLGASLTHTFTGVVTLTAGTLNGGSSILNENATSTTAWNGSGTVFTAGTSTVNFGGVAQTLSATATTFNNLTLSNSGTKTLAAATTINGNLTINTGVTLAAANFGLTFGGDFINSGGTFTAGSSPIVIAGT
ncbi:MAG: hypothetical protein M0Q51_13785, partial [Bacteroidales bacterium]|nr:hypothetical protein [Bacteroidales bacterium]